MSLSAKRYLFGRETFFVTDLVPGFIHGFSTSRKLKATYSGSCLQVRDGSDGNQTNIDFSRNLLNESSFPSAGGNSLFVSVLKDQVGVRDMVSLLNFRPIIRNGTTIIKVNGIPYTQFNGVDQYLTTNTATPVTPITDKDCTVFVVFESQTGTSIQDVFNESDVANVIDTRIISDTRATIFRHSVVRNTLSNVDELTFTSQQPQSVKRVFIFKRQGTDIYVYDETGTLIDSTTFNHIYPNNMIFGLGRVFASAANYFGGKISELLINNTALSPTDQTTVLNNIKTFYGI